MKISRGWDDEKGTSNVRECLKIQLITFSGLLKMGVLSDFKFIKSLYFIKRVKGSKRVNEELKGE
jgi:hypothetical protein